MKQPIANLHAELMPLLMDFDAMCKAHGIQYWLDCGALLGAVRHGGFIPWDDDADVCMTRDNQIKLQRVLDTGAPQKQYCFVQDKTNRVCLCLRKKGCPDAQLDVFCLYTIRQTKWFPLYWAVEFLRTRQRPSKTTLGGLLKRPLWKRMRKYGKMLFRHYMLRANVPAADAQWAFHSVSERCLRSPWQTREIFPLSTVQFDTLTLPAPRNCDDYLTRMYGDYMQPTPVAARILHKTIVGKYYAPD